MTHDPHEPSRFVDPSDPWSMTPWPTVSCVPKAFFRKDATESRGNWLVQAGLENDRQNAVCGVLVFNWCEVTISNVCSVSQLNCRNVQTWSPPFNATNVGRTVMLYCSNKSCIYRRSTHLMPTVDKMEFTKTSWKSNAPIHSCFTNDRARATWDLSPYKNKLIPYYQQHCVQRKAPVFKLFRGPLWGFCPTGATRCTDEVKFGRGVDRRTPKT